MPRNSRRSHVLFLSAADSFQTAHWQPSVDVFQTTRGWVLKYELAGVLPEEVHVIVHGRSVTVDGVRRDARVDACRQSYCMEISYNQFSRTLELPEDVSRMTLATDYRDGMLIVSLSAEANR